MVKRGLLPGIFLLILLFTTITNAQDLTEGYLIESPEQDLVRLDEAHTFYFYVYNISDGKPIDNTVTACYFDLQNRSGISIFEYEADYLEINKWEVPLDISNFSYAGIYNYNARCNSTILGGSLSRSFQVTDKKLIIDIPEALLYILLTLGVLSLFLLSLYFTIITPYSNKTDDKGAVIKITKLKYVKLGLVLITYILFVWVLNVLIGVSDNFVSLTMYYGLISFLFITLNNLALPLSIFIIVLSIFEIIRDTNIQKIINKFGSHK